MSVFLGHLVCTMKADLGRGQPGLMRRNFYETSQSSIDPSTLDSESSALPLEHGGPIVRPAILHGAETFARDETSGKEAAYG